MTYIDPYMTSDIHQNSVQDASWSSASSIKVSLQSPFFNLSFIETALLQQSYSKNKKVNQNFNTHTSQTTPPAPTCIHTQKPTHPYIWRTRKCFLPGDTKMKKLTELKWIIYSPICSAGILQSVSSQMVSHS